MVQTEALNQELAEMDIASDLFWEMHGKDAPKTDPAQTQQVPQTLQSFASVMSDDDNSELPF